MPFCLPEYIQPDFTRPEFADAPCARFAPAPMDGVTPDGFHATSIFPEYFKIQGDWRLAGESRMDCAVALRGSRLDVVEFRNVKAGDMVVLGRTESCEEGVYLHADCFAAEKEEEQSFAFRTGRSRETAFSMDYDNLYSLLRHEREHGNIVWVMGPACAFDADARRAMETLIRNGFAHALLAGNALATHDLEAGYYNTALGQNIYTQQVVKNGHYHHLDILNMVRRHGSISAFLRECGGSGGIMSSLLDCSVPFVLTSSIRDDGPLPEVVASAYEGQNKMREMLRKATTIICLATQLHTIAAGNMTPAFRVVGDRIRPLYIYTVDVSEFVVNKLRDRGSISSISMVTNVQDFVVHVARGVMK